MIGESVRIVITPSRPGSTEADVRQETAYLVKVTKRHVVLDRSSSHFYRRTGRLQVQGSGGWPGLKVIHPDDLRRINIWADEQ